MLVYTGIISTILAAVVFLRGAIIGNGYFIKNYPGYTRREILKLEDPEVKEVLDRVRKHTQVAVGIFLLNVLFMVVYNVIMGWTSDHQ